MELERLRAHAGYSALHRSARDGEGGAVVDLLRKGADKDALDSFGATPLMHAVEEGHLPVAEILLASMADLTVHNTGRGDTALHLAARGGFNDIVDALLTEGADRDSRAVGGVSPLMEAARKGHLPVVNTLLNFEADVTLVCDGDDAIGGECNALHLATYGRHLVVVNALLSRGADKDWRGAFGMTALMIAARDCDLPIVRCLLAEGASVDAVDDTGESAIILALGEFRSDRAPIPEVVETLLAGRADPNIGRTNETKYTPLGLASAKGDIGVMKSLIAYGAGVNACDCHGYTPLHVACEELGELDGNAVLNLLLRSGADETALTEAGKTPADLIDDSAPQAEAVRRLLTCAPADRAWRRRGWLTMLRSRTLKAGDEGGSGGSSSDAGARSVKQRGGSGGGKESLALSTAVAWLRGVDDGVFRNVVGFL